MPFTTCSAWAFNKVFVYGCDAVLQVEHVLNRTKAEHLVATSARAGGVTAVDDAVFPFLDMAVQTHVGNILDGMVKVHLQRGDLGRYCWAQLLSSPVLNKENSLPAWQHPWMQICCASTGCLKADPQHQPHILHPTVLMLHNSHACAYQLCMCHALPSCRGYTGAHRAEPGLAIQSVKQQLHELQAAAEAEVVRKQQQAAKQAKEQHIQHMQQLLDTEKLGARKAK